MIIFLKYFVDFLIKSQYIIIEFFESLNSSSWYILYPNFLLFDSSYPHNFKHHSWWYSSICKCSMKQLTSLFDTFNCPIMLIPLITYERELFFLQIEICYSSISIWLDIHCWSLLWFGLLIYFGLEVLSFHLSNSVKWDIKHIGNITERKNSLRLIRNIRLSRLIS